MSNTLHHKQLIWDMWQALHHPTIPNNRILTQYIASRLLSI